MRLIDADHLKNKLGVWWDKQDEIFAEMIDECPTINPQEPKTGHWNTTDYFIFKCSECECEERTDTRFCPNCGAKMVEPQESEG